MKKISAVQLIALLISCRLFITMTYTPAGDENSLITMLGGMVSGIIQMVIIAAPVLLIRKNSNKNVVELGYLSSAPLGVCLSLIYAFYAVWTAMRTITDFSAFITFAFPVFTAKKTIILFLSITAIYISLHGIEAISRSAVIILALFFIMLAAVLLGTSGRIDIHNFNLSVEKPVSRILTSALASTGRNTEFALLCLLLPCLRSNHGKTAYSYLLIKYLLTTMLIFLYTSILGNFTYAARLPFFHLSSYSNTAIIARFDSLFLVVWTLCAVLKLSLCLWAAGLCIRYIFPKAKAIHSNIIAAVVTLAGIAVYVGVMNTDMIQFTDASLLAVIMLGGVLPAFVYLLSDKENEKKGTLTNEK